MRSELREYWINDGIYGFLNCVLNNQAIVIPMTPLAFTSNRANPTCHRVRTYSLIVFGPTCGALDKVLIVHKLLEQVIWIEPDGPAHFASICWRIGL